MNARDAIDRAKREFMETFTGEGVANVGLEEVRFDDQRDKWMITLGFSRPWDAGAGELAKSFADNRPRTYKIVELADRDGRLLAITNRDVQQAA